MRGQSKRYFVYMLSDSGKMLYTGVTSELQHRVWQHRFERGSEHTSKYRIQDLVWYEETNDVAVAIAKEKQIKTWRRRWKMNLVEFENPEWSDLAADWYC